MKDMKIDFKHPCCQCGNKTLARCKGCKRSLCGRCSSKKSVPIPLVNQQIPAGLCRNCYKLSLGFISLGLGIDFLTFFSQLPEKVDEWTEKYL